MAERAQGGPYDGAELSPSSPRRFLWTDGTRCFEKPGKDRSLYRRTWNRDGVCVLIFSGYKWALCSCGVYHRRVTDKCSLCGEPLPAA